MDIVGALQNRRQRPQQGWHDQDVRTVGHAAG
jgi:hypothetical protein